MKLNRLSPRTVATLAKPGLHADGGGLYLSVTDTGAKSWRFIWRVGGKRREMGLGALASVSLADARTAAQAARSLVATGGNPIEVRKATEQALNPATFREVMEGYIVSKVGSFRNPKHRAQWRTTLEVYGAKLLPMPVASIGTADVLAVLKPIWSTKPETASRVRGRIEAILNAAKAHDLRTGENPAAWRGHLANLLPARPKLSKGHFAARDWKEMPSLMTGLEAAQSCPPCAYVGSS